MAKLRVVEQGDDIIVLGTDQIVTARAALPVEVQRWGGSFPAAWVRRGGKLVSRSTDYAPRDARPGVMFAAVIRTGAPHGHAR